MNKNKDKELKKKIEMALNRKALSLEDIRLRIDWIRQNVPRSEKPGKINDELSTDWKAYETWTQPLDDAQFITDILEPLRVEFGDAILTVEQLEADTGRMRRAL